MDTHTRTSDAHSATLGLGSVLLASLPAALMTEAAPDRYTVEAVFTRRPEKDEVAEILGTRTRDDLGSAGFPTVELAVADRRLVIANTNLEELRDGLAAVIADRLAAISTKIHEKQDAAAIRFEEAAMREHTRTAAVTALAESITFLRAGSAARPRPDATAAAASNEDEQIAGWSSEGGHGRYARP